MNFSYFNPTRLYFGQNCVAAHPEAFRGWGRRALLVTGRHSARANGSLDAVCRILESQGISWSLFDQTIPNPTLASVRQGIAFLKEEQADFVIGIGGGSPMDTAKAIAFLACQDLPDAAVFDSRQYQDKVLPLLMVPTTAGTGSEVTPYAVLMNEAAHSKSSISTPWLYPRAAFLDPQYTWNVGLATTRWTAIDALSHSVEGILSQKGDPLITALALDGIRAFGQCREAMLSGKFTPETRERLLYASLLGGLVLAHTSTTVVHAMGYSLTYYKEIPHGRANGLCLGGYMELVQKTHPQPVDAIREALGFPDLAAFREFLDRLLGEREPVTQEEILLFSREASSRRNIPNSLVPPTPEQVAAIYREGFRRL